MNNLCNNCNNNQKEIDEIFEQYWSAPDVEYNPRIPTSIFTIRKTINSFFWINSQATRKTNSNSKWTIISNICYSLQYLEYLEESLSQLYLTAVLKREQYKVYCMVWWSIIESLLTYICNINIESRVPNLSRIIEDYLIKKNMRNQKLDWEDGLLWQQPILYKMIDYTRKLRNQTHLYSEEYNTDYNVFMDKHLIVVKYIIWEILKFKNVQLYGYLDIQDEVKSRITDMPWKRSFVMPLPYLTKSKYQTFQDRNIERNKL